MKKSKKIIKVLLLLIVFLYLIITWGNKSIVITKYNIENEKIPDSFSGFTIAQVTDLHNDEFGKNNSGLLHKLKNIKPDIIVITGDLIDSRRRDVEVGIEFARASVEIAPTYYVMGNHEFRVYDEYLKMEKRMEQLGVNVLRNEKELIEINGEFIQIIGIDSNIEREDGFYVPGTNNVVILQMLEDINNKELYSVLLSHRPELFNIYTEKNVDLVFTGHAHGGQIRIPFIGGVVAPNQGFFPQYDGGVYKRDNTNMIVSRGLGNSLFPIRVNNRPEIVVTIFK